MVVSLTDKVRFITSVFGSGKLSRASSNIDIWCPICAPSDKSKKKLSIRLADDANHCWTCDWRARSLVGLVKKFGTHEQLLDYRDRFMSDHLKRKYDLEDDEPTKHRISLPSDFVLLPLANKFDPDVKAVLRYVTGRGLTEHDMWYFKLGVSDDPRWKRRVIVPSFDSFGELNYFVARAIDQQRRPKYDNPDNDKLTIIFNEINIDWTKQLVLCEGAFDMFKCGENAVPLLGSSLNEQSLLFNMIIANSTPIALALDADMINKRVYPIAKKLAEYGNDVVIVDVRPFDDPGKMSKVQFHSQLLNASNYDWNDNFNSRLSNVSRPSLRL